MFWFGNRSLDLSLGYRLSEHGSSIQEFNDKVKEGGDRGSLVVVRSEMGEVFGGYTKVKWQLPDTDDFGQVDEQAFLFQLTKKTKHSLYQNELSAVRHWKSQYLFFFGGGSDLAISEHCDQKQDSWSNLGFTYRCPDGLVHESEQAKSYLAGEYCFKVLELEVYFIN